MFDLHARTFRLAPAVASLTAAAALPLIAAQSAGAQQPPTPFQMIRALDLECRSAGGPPPAPNVFIRQLNPVLRDRLPNQWAQLGGLEDVCVPVAKNQAIPPQPVLDFAKWFDLGCFEADAPPVDVDVKLSHLNPQLVGLSDEDVKLVELDQVCLPVRKNNSVIPEGVRAMVSHFDFACYRLAEPTEDANTSLQITHLNPVIREMGFGDHVVDMKRARHLCVPIAKNNQPVPEAVRPYIAWADFLKYRIDVVQGWTPPFGLLLQHLNPLYGNVPPFPTVLHYEAVAGAGS